MPITWLTSLIGSLALIGTPFFSGFYSKDSIIEAVHGSHIAGARFAEFAVLAGVFVTAYYSFRMYFLVFHGEERFGKVHEAHHAEHGADDHETGHTAGAEPGHHGLAAGEKPHESPLVVTLPLILLAIPSAIIGFFTIGPMLFGDFFKDVIFVGESHLAMEELTKDFHGPLAMAIHSLTSAPFWLALAGVASSYYFYLVNPQLQARIRQKFNAIYVLLDNKYYMDIFNQRVFAGGARLLGGGLWNAGDKGLIDGLIVNGSAKVVAWLSTMVRLLQSGYIYHYAFVMILGVLGFLIYFLPFPFAK